MDRVPVRLARELTTVFVAILQVEELGDRAKGAGGGFAAGVGSESEWTRRLNGQQSGWRKWRNDQQGYRAHHAATWGTVEVALASKRGPK